MIYGRIVCMFHRWIYSYPVRGCYGDRNTWNTIPVSEQKNTLNKQIIEHQTKQIEQKENERMKVEQHMNNKTGNEHVKEG
jgi:hypothetical protein